jgi:hypothetical protein
MIKQARLVSSEDGEEKYKVTLSIASRRLSLEDLKNRVRRYMSAHFKKSGEVGFVRNFDAVTITYVIGKKAVAKPAAKKPAAKKKKETGKPLSRPAAKKSAKKPAAKTPIDYMASQRTAEDGSKYYIVLNEDTGEYLNSETGKFQKTFNANTCSYSSRHFARKAIDAHKEATA